MGKARVGRGDAGPVGRTACSEGPLDKMNGANSEPMGMKGETRPESNAFVGSRHLIEDYRYYLKKVKYYLGICEVRFAK